MLEKIRGFAIDMRRHSDRHNIVTLFTRERGRVAFLSSAGTGKQARLRNARLLPLAVVETEVNFRANRELQFLGEISSPMPWSDIHFDPVKSTLATFLSEFLNAYLRQSGQDAALWDFTLDALRRLDSCRQGASNFHIAYVVEFFRLAGIHPDVSDWQEGDWFDMASATFTPTPDTRRPVLAPDVAALIPTIARINMRNFPKFRFSGAQRSELLGALLRYAGQHFPGLDRLRSPGILAELWR